jgi:hypothetical protein
MMRGKCDWDLRYDLSIHLEEPKNTTTAAVTAGGGRRGEIRTGNISHHRSTSRLGKAKSKHRRWDSWTTSIQVAYNFESEF